MRNRGWMFATLTLLLAFGFAVSYGTYVHVEPLLGATAPPATMPVQTATPDRSIIDDGDIPVTPAVVPATIFDDLQSSLEETSQIYADLAGPPDTP